jgi:hypothetical protein
LLILNLLTKKVQSRQNIWTNHFSKADKSLLLLSAKTNLAWVREVALEVEVAQGTQWPWWWHFIEAWCAVCTAVAVEELEVDLRSEAEEVVEEDLERVLKEEHSRQLKSERQLMVASDVISSKTKTTWRGRKSKNYVTNKIRIRPTNSTSSLNPS